jgi:putative two-component system response regulator
MSKVLKKIFVVDDNNASLTACKGVLKSYYDVYPVPSAEKMFTLIEHVIPDLILLDVEMPEIDGYEAAKRLKKRETLKEIPLIFLSGNTDPTSEISGLNMGALDYIYKPFVGDLLLKRIKTHLDLIDFQKKLNEQNKRVEEMRSPLNDIIEAIKIAMDTDDPKTIRDCLSRANPALKQLLALISDLTNCSQSTTSP